MHRIATLALGAALAVTVRPTSMTAQAADAAIFRGLTIRNIGPANMGGRIVDIEAVETDFKRVFVASASGGVFKSVNAGTTWRPIFDDYPSASIGDIALFHPNPDILWVGTGEANNRNSVAWGDGVYKSTDGGDTFTHVGLTSTHQIARVITHHTDQDVVYVCAIGHLWGYSGDRGLFKTTDGGETWTKLRSGLPDDGKTGCTDLVMHPTDPNVLYAAFYHRLRKPWTFHSGSPAGGIFKSTDGGATWIELTNGLPPGETGRIGLAIYRRHPEIVMAFVEAEQSDDLARPGSGVYRSQNGGASWQYVNTYNNRPFYYSQIRINPTDDQRVYLLTTRFMVSEDGGVSLGNGSEDQEIHGDFHAMWIDPNDGDRYYIGDDKGLHLTYDHGEHFVFLDNFAIGQYYRIGVDMRDPYFVYGGLQDNGSYGGPSFARDVRGIPNDYNWKLHWGDGQDVQVDPTNWRLLYTSSENGNFMQYDVPTRSYTRGGPSPTNITNYDAAVPPGERHGGREFRYNWSAPMVMSPHDAATLYFGAQYVFKTTDGGNTWTIISPDLTTNDPVKRVQGQSGGLTPDNTGAEYHCSLTSIAASTITPDVIWVGTDDGNVQLTRNGGATWNNVRRNIPGVPEGIWVDRVEASHHDAGTAYVVFDGHRSDVFTPWIFKTTDYGRTWTDIAADIPDGQVVHVVREDWRNPNLLFAGTEFGLFVSLNGGGSWAPFRDGFPTVAVQDLVIHPRDHDLVVGTHGRSIWIIDDITPLQQLTEHVRQSDAYLFEQRPATLWENTSRGGQRGHFWFAGENPSTFQAVRDLPHAAYRTLAQITYYLGRTATSAPILEIVDVQRTRLRTVTLSRDAGVHRYNWDLEFDPEPYTEVQRVRIVQTFERLLRDPDSPRQMQAAYDEFLSAQTPREAREAVQVLLSPFVASGLSEEYGLPSAGPGTYLLRLTVDGWSQAAALTVRADPMVQQ